MLHNVKKSAVSSLRKTQKQKKLKPNTHLKKKKEEEKKKPFKLATKCKC